MILTAFLSLSLAAGPATNAAAALVRDSAARVGDGLAAASALAAPARETPVYRPEARAVSNWRSETKDGLLPLSLAWTAWAVPSDPAFVARCVKLNNYWCIKRARWDGEIGGDQEGHTGFATAGQGADAAVSLLRRYYGEYGRRSALAIVRRWAPAECAAPAVARVAAPGRAAAPASPALAALAPQGIGRTLRARFLAGHGRGGAPRRVARSPARGVSAPARPAAGNAMRVQPWSALARMQGRPRQPLRAVRAAPLPTIATGIGEAARPSAAIEPGRILDGARLAAEAAALPTLAVAPASSLPLALRPPAPLCGSDEIRIQNYAARIAGSVGVKPGDDLGLFTPEGHATERLAPVLLAMSSVELGALRASPALVAAAIARAEAERGAERRQAEAVP
ncbi:hypothetical protein [Methylobacterium frigidaeris]|uniref:Lytic transglycosylase n=1 Tax=Methylobacterium frigidaeris TaxID=2038277 RepID=A0AA37HD88_9HYPH|nr:hypothetical protein [Methylobacterium frigidaeris]PIK70267.1 hypothetical protein CS379_25550 [Methylobacterium frigidaeris]GJD63351.1 hypothetical protein MPEAHAMD_3517 [Methylobacterium frigidaeris]